MTEETEQADVVVLGMGPGGEEVAGRLAEAGLDVVGIEGKLLGGECPYWGCVPSKMMIRAANLLAEGRRIPGMAGTSTVTPDWAPVARRIRDDATDNWDDRVAVDRFVGKGGRFVRGWGAPRRAGPVVVGDVVYEARGAPWSSRRVTRRGRRPSRDWPSSRASTGPTASAIETETVPASLVVLGGGAIGVELGQVFARFGAEVTIVEGADRLLALEEPESSALAAEVLERDGVDIHTSARVTAVHDDDGDASSSSSREPPPSEATGSSSPRDAVPTSPRSTSPASASTTRRATSTVDDHLRVTDGVWAVGDITGVGAFTHVSMYQADICVEDILGNDPAPADYRALPRVTFTDPEIGSVGLTEAAARRLGLDVRVVVSPVPSSARGWIHKAGNEGFIKLVEDAGRGVLVGATSAGPTGGEVLSMLTLAIHAEIPVERLRRMIYAYPTFHRAVEAALKDLVS